MNDERGITVDFVASGASPDEWKMVIVEEGPWRDAVEVQLGRVQDRLYGCIDAALDGQLASKYPESQGKKIVIQLDCYNLPRDEVAEFFERFSSGVLETASYRVALNKSRFVRGISFELNFEMIH